MLEIAPNSIPTQIATAPLCPRPRNCWPTRLTIVPRSATGCPGAAPRRSFPTKSIAANLFLITSEPIGTATRSSACSAVSTSESGLGVVILPRRQIPRSATLGADCVAESLAGTLARFPSLKATIIRLAREAPTAPLNRTTTLCLLMPPRKLPAGSFTSYL